MKEKKKKISITQSHDLIFISFVSRSFNNEELVLDLDFVWLKLHFTFLLRSGFPPKELPKNKEKWQQTLFESEGKHIT